MKTVLWKELREHARWVPLGIIPMIIVLVLKWRSNELIFDAREYGSSLSLSMLVGLVAGGVAICLGLLQSWPDQRPAARALLLHRGITADAAFGGKLLAGLLLYTAAVFVPLLGMAVFIAFVGIEHRAASPDALLPSALISVAAFCGWLASLLVVQRDAWLFGSRLLPGLTAALAVLGCGVLMNAMLWLTIAIAVATLVAFLAAARSVFVNSAPIATGAGRAGLTLAVTMALLSIAMCVMSMIESYRIQAAYASGELEHHRYVVEFGPDGMPWLTRSKNSWNGYRYEFDQVAKMVPGKSVRDQLRPVEDKGEPLRKWSPVVLTRYNRAGSFGTRFQLITTSIVPDGAEGMGRSWVYDGKLDVVLVYRFGRQIGFQLETKLLPPASVGSFGQLQNWGTHTQSGNAVLLSTTGVYFLPGSGEDVSLIYSWPETSVLLGSEMRIQIRPESDPCGLLLRRKDRVVLLESDLDAETAPRAQSLGTFSGLGELFATEVFLPNELVTADSISIARHPAGDGTFLGLAFARLHNDDQASWFRFAEDGQIKEQERYGDDSNTIEAAGGDAAIVALIPPSAFAFGFAMIAIENQGRGGGISEAWEYSKTHPAETAMIVLLGMLQPIFGILLAVWAARRRGLDKRTSRWWIVWAFWFGPCGSLALLAVYPRIVREPCGACQKATRIDVAACEHCACSLDETPLTGIEIFDRGRDALAIDSQPASV